MLSLAIVLAVGLPAAALAGPLDAPWDYGRAKPAAGEAGPGGDVMLGLVRAWQLVAAPVDGISCPSEPSCSHYAAQAVRRHGGLLGAFLAADRMVHELSEADHSPLVSTPEGWKIDDPVSANDFWLRWR